MSAAPVTVLMAVRNGSRFLRTAIDSILSQSLTDFQFLIVDDESTDDTRQILRSYGNPRIKVLSLERNVGQTAALNLGLRHAQSPWIARMDADDFSAPTRLEEQMQVLEADPGLACVGTAVWEFQDDPAVVETVRRRPEHHDQIRRAALYGAGMIHGSIVVRRAALLEVGAYDERYRYASDREMFIRLLRRHPARNLNKPLLGIRRHPAQDSFSKGAADEYIAIFRRLMNQEGFTAEEREILRRNLAYSYLFRAKCHRKLAAPAGVLRDWGWALRTSPRTCLRSALGTVGRFVLPSAVQDRLRGDFWRRAS